MGFPGKMTAIFQALQFMCFLFPLFSFMYTEDWDVVYCDCFSGVELAADVLSTLVALWFHIFGPTRDEKIPNVFLFAMGFGLNVASLIGYIGYINPRGLKYTDPPSEDGGMHIRGTGNHPLHPVRLVKRKEKANQMIKYVVLSVGFVAFVTFILCYMGFTADDQPFAVYLGSIIMIVSELAKTVWSVWVRYGEWKHKQFRKDIPVVYRMKQVQSLLFCSLSAVEFFSSIPDELSTSISVQLLHITSALVMVLAGAQLITRWIYEPVVKPPRQRVAPHPSVEISTVSLTEEGEGPRQRIVQIINAGSSPI